MNKRNAKIKKTVIKTGRFPGGMDNILYKTDPRFYCPGSGEAWIDVPGVVSNFYYSVNRKIWNRAYPKDLEDA